MGIIIVTLDLRLREERDNLQFEQTDGEESEGGRYGRQDFKDSFRRIGDKIQREVDKYTSRITLQEDPGQVIASLRQELNDLFDVKNGKGPHFRIELYICFNMW